MRLFVYGTLQFPEILRALIGTTPELLPARLKGYRVAALTDRVFPGLVKENTSTAKGFIVELTDDQYDIIAAWEDEEYVEYLFHSEEISVNTTTSSQTVLAFLWNNESLVLPENWDREKFMQNYLQDYAENRIPHFLKTTTLK